MDEKELKKLAIVKALKKKGEMPIEEEVKNRDFYKMIVLSDLEKDDES